MHENIVDIVERIRLLPDARVDRNYRQGRDTVFEQLLQIPGNLDQATVERFIARSQKRIAQLTKLISPNELPADYHFFLEYYGGLTIEPKVGSPQLNVFGIGPATEAWYGDVVEYHLRSARSGIEQLYIALWSSRLRFSEQTQDILEIISTSKDALADNKPRPPYRWIEFFLDITGTVQKYSVLAAKPERNKEDQRQWKKVANSFTEWLDLVATSRGTFGYKCVPDDL